MKFYFAYGCIDEEGFMGYELCPADDESYDALENLEYLYDGNSISILDNTNGAYTEEYDLPEANYIANSDLDNIITADTFDEARNKLADFVEEILKYEDEAEAIREAEVYGD